MLFYHKGVDFFSTIKGHNRAQRRRLEASNEYATSLCTLVCFYGKKYYICGKSTLPLIFLISDWCSFPFLRAAFTDCGTGGLIRLKIGFKDLAINSSNFLMTFCLLASCPRSV